LSARGVRRCPPACCAATHGRDCPGGVGSRRAGKWLAAGRGAAAGSPAARRRQRSETSTCGVARKSASVRGPFAMPSARDADGMIAQEMAGHEASGRLWKVPMAMSTRPLSRLSRIRSVVPDLMMMSTSGASRHTLSTNSPTMTMVSWASTETLNERLACPGSKLPARGSPRCPPAQSAVVPRAPALVAWAPCPARCGPADRRPAGPAGAPAHGWWRTG
jgi:hypothetical protein